MSQFFQHLPVRVEKQNGWDFSKLQIRGAFLVRRSFLHPGEINHCVPTHTICFFGRFLEFSRQAIDVLSEVFDRQLADAAECHLKHPVNACSWKQRSGVILMVSVSDAQMSTES